MKNEGRHYYIPPQLHEKVKTFAEENGIRDNDAVKLLVNRGLKEPLADVDQLDEKIRYLTLLCEGAFVEVGKAAYLTISQSGENRDSTIDRAKRSFRDFYDKVKADVKYSNHKS